MGSTQTTKGAWSGTQKGPRTIKALVLVYRWGSRRGHSFSHGLHTMVFQAEIYAIKACIMENMEKGYKRRNIYILSESGNHQGPSQLPDKFQISLGLPSIPGQTGRT
jgi:hypothetical protein